MESDFVVAFFVIFFLVTIVLGPLFGAESRPGWLDVDKRPRNMVDPPFDGGRS